MNPSRVWYEITKIEKVNLCGYASDTTYHPHRIATDWALALIENGQRTVKVDGVPVIVNKGDFKVMPEGSVQEPMKLDTQSAFYVHFQAVGKVIEPPAVMDSERILLPLFGRLPLEPDCLALARYLNSQFMKPYVGQKFLCAQLKSLLSAISLDLQRNSIWLRGRTSQSDLILSFIEEHMLETLHAEDYEKAFGLSYHRLNQVFKQKFQYTIKQYHSTILMRHAATLLLAGKNAHETARLCGFDDYFYFIRCFSEAYGIAPGRFQKQNGIQ